MTMSAEAARRTNRIRPPETGSRTTRQPEVKVEGSIFQVILQTLQAISISRFDMLTRFTVERNWEMANAKDQKNAGLEHDQKGRAHGVPCEPSRDGAAVA